VNERRAELIAEAEDIRGSARKVLGDDLCALSIARQTAAAMLARSESMSVVETHSGLVRALRLQDQLTQLIKQGSPVI
jgi:hypothetical protein